MNDIFAEGSSIAALSPENNRQVGCLAQQVKAKTLVDRQRMTDILMQNHSFPEMNRVIIWRFMLQLPMNTDVYNTFARAKIHKSIENLRERLPVRSGVAFQRLIKVMSCLTYWHPPLAECDWLPALVFPFLQTCERDSLVTFEIMATVLTNWCTEWLHFVPNPPITILSRIDAIAQEHGGEAPLSVAWPALRSFFGEVATTKAGMMLLDNILAAKPVFIEYLVAAYVLMEEEIIDEFNVLKLLKKARLMFRKDLKKDKMSDISFTPLPQGHYPVIVIVEKSPMWREKELQRIRSEAATTKQHMELREQIDQECAKIDRKRRNWVNERNMLKIIEQEQMAEFRRIERQSLCRETKREQREMITRRAEMEAKRAQEARTLEEWRHECEAVRSEVEGATVSTKEVWTRWLRLKEEGAQLTRDEAENEITLLKERDQIQREELEAYARTMAHGTAEEEQALNAALSGSRKLDEERFATRERLEHTKQKIASDFQAFQARQKSRNAPM